jgi:copper chaperone CopZ
VFHVLIVAAVAEFRQTLFGTSPLRSGRVAERSETIQVSGIRCERCVHRLAAALHGHDGLELANANLVGQVSLTWDDERTSREALLAAMARAGFREALPA